MRNRSSNPCRSVVMCFDHHLCSGRLTDLTSGCGGCLHPGILCRSRDEHSTIRAEVPVVWHFKTGCSTKGQI